MQCFHEGFDVIHLLWLLHTLFLQVTLLTHLTRLCQPRNELLVNIFQASQSKGMNMIARRDGLNPSKPG